MIRWALVSAILLGALLVFAVGAFGSTGRQAQTAFHVGIFAIGAAWTVRRIFRPYRLRGSILLVPLAAAPLCGVWQIASGASVYPFETWNAVLNWGAYGVLFLLALNTFSDSRIRSRIPAVPSLLRVRVLPACRAPAFHRSRENLWDLPGKIGRSPVWAVCQSRPLRRFCRAAFTYCCF